MTRAGPVERAALRFRCWIKRALEESTTSVFSLEIKPEAGADPFILWQRVLQGELGLRLASRRGAVDVLVIDNAEKTPTAN